MADKKFIQKALSKKGSKGALHRALGVPEGQTIPASKVEAATHSKNKRVAAEARLAQTLSKINRKK